MQVDKQQIVEHLQTCIEIESKKDDERTAKVLGNLRQEILDGSFDYGGTRD
ncbi:hypothetical protein [Cohnella silvisoli]|uniref:Uncharacterized protein n=1 Tax=Cohnella silvisoli TaxID=2873699 RepID=A0ABV1L4N0_9BACL|nr:hypothetical protein [Cohnella silvisoli]MCD9026031.1 hypothetical protein [Cohnella silvisoli]